jgi:hypothetical protein
MENRIWPVCTVSDPFAWKTAGEKLQASTAGSPEQDNVTVPVKPPVGVRVSEAVPISVGGKTNVAGLAEIVNPGVPICTLPVPVDVR